MTKSTKVIALIVIVVIAGLGIWWFANNANQAVQPQIEPVSEETGVDIMPEDGLPPVGETPVMENGAEFGTPAVQSEPVPDVSQQ